MAAKKRKQPWVAGWLGPTFKGIKFSFSPLGSSTIIL